MKYYKLVTFDNQIVGAITSRNFIRYSSITKNYLICNESKGEYISYEGELYRAAWMAPIKQQKPYTEVQVMEITAEEYAVYRQAINDNIPIEDDVEPIIPDDPINPIEDGSIDFIRSSKINAMSYACRQTIESGINLSIRGEMQHFALTIQDQLNLMSLNVLAQTEDLIPYHADGETCVFYTANEIKQIIAAANAHKNYHTTYYNALKNYINSLETIEEIAAITYGTPIPDEYKSEVLKVME